MAGSSAATFGRAPGYLEPHQPANDAIPVSKHPTEMADRPQGDCIWRRVGRERD